MFTWSDALVETTTDRRFFQMERVKNGFSRRVIGKCRSFFWPETGVLNARVNGDESWGEATVAEVFDRNRDQHQDDYS